MKRCELKLLTILMMAAVFFVFGAVQASAAEIVHQGNCGSNLTWTLDDEGKLTVSGTGDMTHIPEFTQYASDIKSVVMEEGVTSIGNFAFQRASLTGELDLPDSLITIGSYAFNGDTGLTGDLVIPSHVTTIGAQAFYGCTGFNGDLVLSDSITEIGGSVFYGCSNLTGGLHLPEQITSIGKFAFSGCTGLTGDLVIPGSIKTIGTYAFNGCTGLTGNLTIQEGVTEIGDSVFNGYSFLKGTLTIPESVTRIGKSSFAGCSGLTGNLLIPSSVTTIDDNAFNNCVGFSGDLVIMDSVTSIGGSAFNSCAFQHVYVVKGSYADSYFESGKTYLYEPLPHDNSYLFFNTATICLKADEFVPISNYLFSSADISDISVVSGDASVALYDEEQLAGIREGQTTLTASAEGHSVEVDVIVLDSEQADIAISSISFQNDTMELNQGEKKVNAVALSPANTTQHQLIWTSSDPDVATVNNGLVTGIGYGSATITAKSQANNSITATFTVNVTQDKTEAIIKLPDNAVYTIEKGKPVKLTYYVYPYDAADQGSIAFESSDNDILEIDEHGVMTGVAVGQATITASIGDISQDFDISVISPLKSISLDRSSVHIYAEDSDRLTVSFDPDDTTDDRTIIWESSKPGVATVDDNGTITGVSEGIATITATVGSHSASCKVSVTYKIHLTGISLNYDQYEIGAGDDFDLAVVYTPSNTTDDKTVTWTSSEEDVATIDENGKVTALTSGETVITATVGEFSAECSVTVFEKEMPVYEIPQNIETTCNSTLGSIEIPDGFAWADSEQSVGSAGSKSFKASYTPEDPAHYQIVNDIDIPVNVIHNFSQEYTSNENTHWHVCVCGAKSEESEHSWDEGTVTQTPDCVTEGVRTFRCSVCDATKTETIDPNGHTPAEPAKENEVKATCAKDGGYDMVTRCETCEEVLASEHFVIQATGEHTWDEGTVTQTPDCDTEGVRTFKCSVCDATKTEAIDPNGHTPTEPAKENETGVTCTTDGCYDMVTRCEVCDAILESEHTIIPATGEHIFGDWRTISTATYDTEGLEERFCTYGCGETEQRVIPALPKTSIKGAVVSGLKKKVYTGKTLTQKPVVKKGTTALKEGTDYTVSYKNNKNVGKASVIITGKTKYKDSVTVYFNIVPKGTALSSLTAVKKGFTAKWKKQAAQTNGYQIRYSLKSSMASPKTVNITKASTVSKKITKLKAKKKYYVQIRTYKTVNGKKWYSAWSTKKAVTTKK